MSTTKFTQPLILAATLIVLLSCTARNVSDSKLPPPFDINQTASADDAIIKDILDQGTARRFIVPDSLLLKHVARAVTYNSAKGRVLFRVTGGKTKVETVGETLFVPKASRHNYTAKYIDKDFEFDHIPRLVNPGVKMYRPFGIPIFPGGDGTVFMFLGKANNHIGDVSDPLRFVYMQGKGLVYLGGQGKVTDVDGAVLFESRSLHGKGH